MKVGIIRCQSTEDICPGTTDFKVIRDKTCAFEGIEGNIDIIGFVSCGGCPGKKAITRAEEMVKRGAEAIVLASCVTKGNPIGFPCPHAQEIIKILKKRLGNKVNIFEYTH